LTFDLEEWFHAHNLGVPPSTWSYWPLRTPRIVDALLDLLDEHATMATFFVLGWLARRAPDMVRRIAARGHEIASHGYRHRLASEQSPHEFRRDVQTSRKLLEDLSNRPILGYRAPRYSIRPDMHWALNILEQSGFTYDSSVYPARSWHGKYGQEGTPRSPFRITGQLWEFPLPVWQVGSMKIPTATGAYFRIMPFWVTRQVIAQYTRLGIPAVINIHPWELDPHQPRYPAAKVSRLIHYMGLGGTWGKLRSLLSTHRFGPLCGQLSRIASVRYAFVPQVHVMPTRRDLNQPVEPFSSEVDVMALCDPYGLSR